MYCRYWTHSVLCVLLQEKSESLHKCKSELVATRQTAILAQQTLEELQTTCQRLDEVRVGTEFDFRNRSDVQGCCL